MERKDSAWIPGIILLVVGVFSLLGNFGVLGVLSTLAWTVLFGLMGFAFLGWFGRDHSQWWTLIPGTTLIGLALTMFIGGDLGGTIFLGAMSLGFAAIYILNRAQWWAIIPAGTLLTLALVTRMGDASGTTLFLGLAVTFAVVWLESHHWAVYPAVACLVLAILTANWVSGIWSIVWALVLIALGAYLLRPRGGGSIKH
jgi:uncharacterized membrane protein